MSLLCERQHCSFHTGVGGALPIEQRGPDATMAALTGFVALNVALVAVLRGACRGFNTA
jgi:hypothetical protein